MTLEIPLGLEGCLGVGWWEVSGRTIGLFECFWLFEYTFIVGFEYDYFMIKLTISTPNLLWPCRSYRSFPTSRRTHQYFCWIWTDWLPPRRIDSLPRLVSLVIRSDVASNVWSVVSCRAHFSHDFLIGSQIILFSCEVCLLIRFDPNRFRSIIGILWRFMVPLEGYGICKDLLLSRLTDPSAQARASNL